MINDLWIRNYELVKEYYLKNGNVDIPFSHAIYDEEKKGYIRLGLWLYDLRKKYNENKLSNEEIQLLNYFNINWNIKRIFKWDEYYHEAKKYYEDHNNLLVPITYEVKNKNGEVLKLGHWIYYQRHFYRNRMDGLSYNINDEQINLLNKLDMKWYLDDKNISTIWFRKYYEVKEYYEKNKSYENIDIDLKKWINRQKNEYKKGILNKEKIELFNEIGINLDSNNLDSKWLFKYNLAKKYFEKHGNLLIPSDYVILLENDNEVKLGNWINMQRKAYKSINSNKISSNTNTINEEKIKLLNEIKMIWNKEEYLNYLWMKKYELAKKYYLEYGSLLMKSRTYVLDENGKFFNLASWLKLQRKLKNKPDSLDVKEKIKLLDEIDMIWDYELLNSKVKKIENNFEKYYDKDKVNKLNY